MSTWPSLSLHTTTWSTAVNLLPEGELSESGDAAFLARQAVLQAEADAILADLDLLALIGILDHGI